MLELYLIRGIPGSGKSTFANNLLKSNIVDIVIEADDYFIRNDEYKFDATKLKDAHEYCRKLAYNSLATGFNIAVSNTSCSEWEVGIYDLMAIEFNAKFTSLVVENRHGNSSIRGVPEEKVQQMKNRFSVRL